MQRVEKTGDERISIVHSVLIIRVPALTYYTGMTEDEFAEKHSLWGLTNGEIWFMAEMVFPWDHLEHVAFNILTEYGLKENIDWVLTYERNCYLDPFESGYLYRDLPELQGLDWIDSIITETGNWVWYKENQQL